MPTRGLIVLAVATVATVVATGIAVDKRYRQTVLEARGGEVVFPELRGRARAALTKSRSLARGPCLRWSAAATAGANAGLGGYPARVELVETVLSGIADLRYLEPKTARAALYPKLGVEDAGPGAGSTRLTLGGRRRRLSSPTSSSARPGRAHRERRPGGRLHSPPRP